MASSCLGESDGLTFWLAGLQDYNDVMAMSQGIYDGNDYLPHRYHCWMTEPGRTVIVARRAGRLVALESGLVVDEGHTLVLEGLRVCPSERGRGVAGVIQRFADGYMKRLYPSIKMKRMTRGDDPGPQKLAKFTLLARRAALSLSGEANSFEAFISYLKSKLNIDVSVPEMVPLDNVEQLRSIFLDPKMTSRVQVPGGAIIQDWQPLQPMEGNLEILQRRNLTWLVDKQEEPVFLSFYTPPYPIPFQGGSLRLNVDLFGTDQTLARRALVGHFEKAWQRGELKGNVRVIVYMNTSLWEGLRDFCEGDPGVTRYSDYWEQLYLERSM